MKEQTIKKELTACLKELHLPAIRSCYEQQAIIAQAETLSYEEYLLELTLRERETRRNNRIQRYLKQSCLPVEKSMPGFDLKRLPRKVGLQVKTLLDGTFLARKENVLAFGNPGSGKTHLVCAVAQELIRKGYRIYFNSCSLLVQELLSAKRELQLSRMLKKLAKFDAVVIDDIGYVQQNRREMEVLFTLLAERYERGSVMITSNLPFSQWENIFKDPVTTAAAIDRMVHHSIIIELNLPSYRMEEAKTKKKEGGKN